MALSRNMIKKISVDRAFSEDLVKILSYIASLSFILVVVFTLVYMFVPGVTNEFQGIDLEFPFVKVINAILMFAISSINSFFTYVFLVTLGVISFVGAQYLEDQLASGEKEEEEESVKDRRVEIIARETTTPKNPAAIKKPVKPTVQKTAAKASPETPAKQQAVESSASVSPRDLQKSLKNQVKTREASETNDFKGLDDFKKYLEKPAKNE